MTVKELKEMHSKDYKYSIVDINYRDINFFQKDMEEEELDKLEVLFYKEEPVYKYIIAKVNTEIKLKKKRRR